MDYPPLREDVSRLGAAAPSYDNHAENEARAHLAETLLGAQSGPNASLPDLAELARALLALAAGTRKKVLLAVADNPSERLPWCAFGPELLVSLYTTNVHTRSDRLDRPLSLTCCASRPAWPPSLRHCNHRHGPSGRDGRRLAALALGSCRVLATQCRGGSWCSPWRLGGWPRTTRRWRSVSEPAFPWVSRSPPIPPRVPTSTRCFSVDRFGRMSAGRRSRSSTVRIYCSPRQRLLAAARALVEAWEAGRPLNIRLREGPLRNRRPPRAQRGRSRSRSLQTVAGASRRANLDVPSAASHLSCERRRSCCGH